MADTNTINGRLMNSLGLPSDTLTKLQTAEPQTFTQTKNAFLTALFNKISLMVVDTLQFNDPFGKWYGQPINYGDTIENIYVDVPTGYDYNANKDVSPFVKAPAEVKTLYLSINYQMQYETTITDVEIRRAVFTPNGLMNLVTKIMSTMPTASMGNRYFATIGMLATPGIYAKGVESVTYATGNDEDLAKKATKAIIDCARSMSYLNKTNNKLKVMQNTPRDKLILVIKGSVLDKINLDYLTGVFNLSKVDLLTRIVDIETFSVTYIDNTTGSPVEKTKESDIDFVLIDERGLDLHMALQDAGMIYNPRDLSTNHYYNEWALLGYKYWFNARAFKLTAQGE